MVKDQIIANCEGIVFTFLIVSYCVLITLTYVHPNILRHPEIKVL